MASKIPDEKQRSGGLVLFQYGRELLIGNGSDQNFVLDFHSEALILCQ